MARQLGWLREALGSSNDDVLLMGSSVLLLHGLRDEIADVDLFVRPNTYRLLRLRGWEERRPNPHDTSFLVWAHGPVPACAFVRARMSTPQVDTEETWRRSHWHAGWRCADLDLIAEWKEHAASNGSAKHRADAARIRERLREIEIADSWSEAL